ncbi:hypothetical protein AAVH_10905 [Aphelenchoides avenae]|nr:hypothetical protein AAVH_10905 [Aphelenchus avenae]
MPQANADHAEGTSPPEEAISREATTKAAFTVQEDHAARRKRSRQTAKEWNYDEDDERDNSASKRMKNRFNKDLNATASGEESEGEADPEDPEATDTDDYPEKVAGGMQQPSNVSVEINQMARTVNTKTQYAIDSWGISDADSFRHLYQTICELDSNQVRITDFMWKLMPTKAIRYWLRRTDVAAVPAGEALAIYPCTQVHVDEMHWSQKINDTYADIPVTFDGKLWFFQPGSRDLQRQSRTVNCSSKAVNVYRSGSIWLSSDGRQTHVNKLEHHMKLKHHSMQMNLSAPIVYQSDAAEVADRLTRITNYERRINRLEDVMHAVESEHRFQEATPSAKQAKNSKPHSTEQ